MLFSLEPGMLILIVPMHLSPEFLSPKPSFNMVPSTYKNFKNKLFPYSSMTGNQDSCLILSKNTIRTKIGAKQGV